MKRQLDGNIRINSIESTRARSLQALKGLLCPQMYHSIAHLSTIKLLGLLASLRPAEEAAGSGAGIG